MCTKEKAVLTETHSVVGGVLELSHPCLISVLFIGPSLLEMKFFQNLFPLVSYRNGPERFGNKGRIIEKYKKIALLQKIGGKKGKKTALFLLLVY